MFTNSEKTDLRWGEGREFCAKGPTLPSPRVRAALKTFRDTLPVPSLGEFKYREETICKKTFNQ